MSNQSIPLSDLGNAKGFKFEKIGDSVAGRITKIERKQQTEFQTNKPMFFDDGVTPKMQLVVTLQLADGTETALFARGGNYDVAQGEGLSMENAIREAARAAGATSLDAGAELAVQHSGLSTAKSGLNPAKLFKAAYKPAPTTSVPLDGMFSS